MHLMWEKFFYGLEVADAKQEVVDARQEIAAARREPSARAQHPWQALFY
jgi:hypothetical protein